MGQGLLVFFTRWSPPSLTPRAAACQVLDLVHSQMREAVPALKTAVQLDRRRAVRPQHV